MLIYYNYNILVVLLVMMKNIRDANAILNRLNINAALILCISNLLYIKLIIFNIHNNRDNIIHRNIATINSFVPNAATLLISTIYDFIKNTYLG